MNLILIDKVDLYILPIKWSEPDFANDEPPKPIFNDNDNDHDNEHDNDKQTTPEAATTTATNNNQPTTHNIRKTSNN